MSLLSWLRLVAHNRKRTRSGKPPRRLILERFEARTVLSFDFGYALGLGSPGVDIGHGVAADSAGNAIVAGSFSSGSIDLDPGPGTYALTRAGTGADGFVSNYDPQGGLRWSAHFASSAGNGAFAVAIDNDDNVFVSGSVGEALQILPSSGPFTNLSASGNESFLAKFDSNGNLLWARTLGEAGDNHFANDLDTDDAGNVYATGTLYDGTQWAHRAFIAKYDGMSGTTVWSRLIQDGAAISFPLQGYTTYATGMAIEVDVSGNVGVVGSYLGTIDFNPAATQANWLTNKGNGFDGDVFVLKLDAAGNHVWAGSLGGRYHDGGSGIAVDAASNIFVSGGYASDDQNDYDPGPGTLPLPGSGGFVVKIDPNGNLVWARGDMVGSEEIDLDASANVYVIGSFSNTVDADPGPANFFLTSAGGQDIVISKLDAAGNFVGAAALGGPSFEKGRAIAVDGEGNIYTTGTFQATADFDPGVNVYNLTSTLDANDIPTSDVFLSKLTVTDSPTPPISSLAISDVTIIEGTAGTTEAIFTVSLSAASAETLIVSFATSNGTAVAGSDYLANSGTLTFAPGEVSHTVSILVNGDVLNEAEEIFLVNLSNPMNAVIADNQGVGTILNDDPLPSLTISDVSLVEGQSGTKAFVFTVRLSTASGQSVTVNYATANGTAKTSNNDYQSTSGLLTFAPGETVKTITIVVIGDKKKEANETFFVDLFGAAGALFTKNRGIGTILNDD